MRVMRMCRTAVILSSTLLAGLMVACGPDKDNSGTEQSTHPTTSSVAPSGKASAAPSLKPSVGKSADTGDDQQTPATPTQQGDASDEPTTEPSDPAKNDPEIEEVDIALTHNSACSPGVTIGLDKLVGWVDGPFKAYIWFKPVDGNYSEYATTPYSGVNANPREDWHFACDGKAPGRYSLKFVSDDVDNLPTEPVAITVY